MSSDHNTLFLRLAGPMQSWGTSSRFQLRRTDPFPSKSGVLGILLCAMGISRENSAQAFIALTTLLMGVRVDRQGTLDWDYHTAGAKIGIRRADGMEPKRTASTGEYETLLSRRQYLFDASFLVALQGDMDIINECAEALSDPVWPLFLGRKCCVPAEPVFAGTGSFDTLHNTLSSVPWQPRIAAIDDDVGEASRTLDIYMEHSVGSQIPNSAHLVHDVPLAFGFYSHAPRWIIRDQVTVPVGVEIQRPLPKFYARRPDYNSSQWKTAKSRRLELDNYLCVFCKSPAVEVHHVSYDNIGYETNSDLRSLCEICHDACTMLEYGRDMRAHRIDPSDPALRQMILNQIERLLKERRHSQRRKLLRTARIAKKSFFDIAPGVVQDKEH